MYIDRIAECGFTGHSHADDTQVHISTPATDDEVDASGAMHHNDWMASKRLKLSEDKTQVIWKSSRQQLDKITTGTLTQQNEHHSAFLSG